MDNRERRKYFRIPMDFSVVNFESTVEDISIRHNGVIKDISEGGIGVESTSIPKEYSTVLLDFTLPGTDCSFNDVKGLVRWVEDNKFGIEFLDLTNEDREKIKEYLKDKE